MKGFKVEHKVVRGQDLNQSKEKELIMQIESLQRLYRDMGTDSDNIRTIFALTIGYLKGKVDKLVVRSFFDVLVNQDKLDNDKELNILNCFDTLIGEHEPTDSNNPLVTVNNKKGSKTKYKEVA